MARWALAISLLLAAGCMQPSVPDVELGDDVALFARLENDGMVPASYQLEVRDHQAGRPAEDQDGPVRWRASGDIRPGENRTEATVLDGQGDHWVVLRLGDAAAGSGGFSFHLDPAACDDIVTLAARAHAGLTGTGGSYGVVGCDGTHADGQDT